MPENSAEVEDLLKSVLVPSFPPNRSQWKKLELAMKFIKLSKQSVAGTKKVKILEWNVGVLRNKENIEVRTLV